MFTSKRSIVRTEEGGRPRLYDRVEREVGDVHVGVRRHERAPPGRVFSKHATFGGTCNVKTKKNTAFLIGQANRPNERKKDRERQKKILLGPRIVGKKKWAGRSRRPGVFSEKNVSSLSAGWRLE